MRRGWWIGMMIAFGVLMVIAFGLATQYLWNWLVPDLFAGPMITFWQAVGLLALSKVLLWGFWGHGGRRWGHYGSGRWKPYWRERLARMTPEERARFKQKMEDKWCSWQEDAPAKETGTSNV